MYDLLVKGGVVVDPARGIHDPRDIGISQGKIAAVAANIAPGAAKKVIDAKGMIVTPGLIDMHVHVADGILNSGAAPDEAGVRSGVTTVCDGGSTGYANFIGLKRYVIPQARTDVFCYLNMHPIGLAVMPEAWSPHSIDPEAMLKTVEENRDIIKGIKIRAIGTVAESLGMELMRATKRVAVEANLPLMIHIGIQLGETTSEDIMNTLTRELLSLLDKGDILSHVFTAKVGGVIKPDGSVLPELRQAMERGVALDMAHGMSNLSFEIAKVALAQGILPTILTTDVSNNTIKGPVFSLLVTMSKFLALGLSLDQVIAMTTINPARVLGEEERRGSLKVGMPADVSLLELSEGDFLFSDGKSGNTLKGKSLLVPKLTLKSGVEIVAQSRFN